MIDDVDHCLLEDCGPVEGEAHAPPAGDCAPGARLRILVCGRHACHADTVVHLHSLCQAQESDIIVALSRSVVPSRMREDLVDASNLLVPRFLL